MADADFTPGQSPTADQVVSARRAAGLTLAQAAESVYLSGYPRWAEYESGKRVMDAARYELFLIKHQLHPAIRARA
jgi:hypothetical protein